MPRCGHTLQPNVRGMRSVQLMRSLLLIIALGLAGCQTQGAAVSSPVEGPRTVEAAPEPAFDGTPDEWAAAMVDCMRGEGFAAQVDGTGYAIPDIAGDARRLASEANARCRQRVGVIPVEPMDDAQVARHFQALLATADCLRNEGYMITDAPAQDVFMEAYPMGDAWNPYTDIVRQNVSDGE